MLYPSDESEQAGAVFTTRQHEQDVVWVLTTYDESAFQIRYVIVRPGKSAGQLDISLKALGVKEAEASVNASANLVKGRRGCLRAGLCPRISNGTRSLGAGSADGCAS